MNNILQLKGTFQQKQNSGHPGFPNIPKNSTPVKASQIKNFINDLNRLNKYWAENKVIKGALIDIHYNKVVAKSNRVGSIFAKGEKTSNSSVVGARFSNDETENNHIITHYILEDVIIDTINKLENSLKLLESIFGGSIDHEDIKRIKERDIDFSKYNLSLSSFCKIITDCYYISKFDIPNNKTSIDKQSIITIYKTDGSVSDVMKKIGIDVPAERMINETTMLLRQPQIELLKNKAPYLIAMATEDISKISKDDIKNEAVKKTVTEIEDPKDEPTIGVIDTMFDERVYFSKWVRFEKMISDDIPIDQDDYDHGTAVSSIVVDGPSINPDLDDGCGKFKVRHFGVAAKGKYSAFSIMKLIQEIVDKNQDIRVWNLSLGSDNEINLNSISPEAAILDKIQYEKDVIFIVAGTNNRNPQIKQRIGAPADSINSIVVNSINSSGQYSSYSRHGLVLSFFNKPDVSSYGGDKKTNDFIRVCCPTGESLRTGTSFAAPWVTRKVAYLMEVLGLSREITKALIVDSAAGWDNSTDKQKLAPLIGHGIVPKHIRDIIKSPNDEIRFVINGVSELYDTYTYNLPVPIKDEKYPFVAKATLCYFPKCSINQGVDYTNTELDIYIGRVGSSGILSINKNKQSIADGFPHYMYEVEARKWYRKWDNTKHVEEELNDKSLPRKIYPSRMWGISLKTKERLETRDGEGIKFGLVVTLKEIYGVNRINDFIHQCELRGWLINKINVENRIEIYNKAQETIEFDI